VADRSCSVVCNDLLSLYCLWCTSTRPYEIRQCNAKCSVSQWWVAHLHTAVQHWDAPCAHLQCVLWSVHFSIGYTVETCYSEHSYSKFLHIIVNTFTWPSEYSCIKLQLAIVNFWFSEEFIISPWICCNEISPYVGWFFELSTLVHLQESMQLWINNCIYTNERICEENHPKCRIILWNSHKHQCLKCHLYATLYSGFYDSRVIFSVYSAVVASHIDICRWYTSVAEEQNTVEPLNMGNLGTA
jgi:hypothetical protein